MTTKLAYGIREAAAQLGVSRATMCRLISRGEVAAIKIGARTLIPYQALVDYMSNAKGVSP